MAMYKCSYCGKGYETAEEMAECILKCSEQKKKAEQEKELKEIETKIKKVQKEINNKNKVLKTLKLQEEAIYNKRYPKRSEETDLNDLLIYLSNQLFPPVENL